MFVLNLVDGWTPLMGGISSFHDHVMVVISLISFMVLYILIFMFIYSGWNRFFHGNESLETIWTIFPGVILGLMAMPSLHTLYLADDISDATMSIKAVGHQWYWSYEYGDFEGVEFDSYMTQSDDLALGSLRLLEVDNRVVVPYGTSIRLLTTSADVIHSWTIPSFGVKVDAVPGRLNQLGFFSYRVGLAYGQCSEICGALHSFMPITVEVTSPNLFEEWLSHF